MSAMNVMPGQVSAQRFPAKEVNCPPYSPAPPHPTPHTTPSISFYRDSEAYQHLHECTEIGQRCLHGVVKRTGKVRTNRGHTIALFIYIYICIMCVCVYTCMYVYIYIYMQEPKQLVLMSDDEMNIEVC